MELNPGNTTLPPKPERNQPPRKRKVGQPGLPSPLRHQLAAFAASLRREYRPLFLANPDLKKRVAGFLAALLLPKPRRRGRPGRPDVTKAIRLLRKFARLYPEERREQHWARVYPMVIGGYGEMNAVEQRHAREELRERARWRYRQHKRRRRAHRR